MQIAPERTQSRENTGKRDKAAMDAFRPARSPETFKNWAAQAGIRNFEIIGEGGLTEDDPETGLGVWGVFRKEYKA